MSLVSDHSLPVSLSAHPSHDRILAIIESALAAADPAAAVGRHLHLDSENLQAGARTIPVRDIGRIFLAGGGKAAAPMAWAAAEILGERLTAGVLVTKYGHSGERPLPPQVRLVEAGHPVPDLRGIQAAQQMLDLLADLQPEDLVICLISGGGSALLTAPAEGITLPYLEDLTARLLASGADIREINTIRKHLSRIKGGRLAAHCAPARVISLILSDVVGDPVDMIASGPTVPDPTSLADARNILETYELPQPPALVETPKPGSPLFERADNILIGSNRIAAEAALRAAKASGFSARILTTSLTGEAQDAGRWLAGQAARMPTGAVWIAGGETTVTLPSNHGLGGRNLETALAAVPLLAGREDILLVTLATDGGDGPTGAAGAVVSGETARRAAGAGLSPEGYLHRHDAYTFFAALQDLLVTGPTRTNVNDLVFLLNLPA